MAKAQTAEVMFTPAYDEALRDIIGKAQDLSQAIQELEAEVRATGRLSAPAFGLAKAMEHQVSESLSRMRSQQPELFGLQRPDPEAERIREAEDRVKRAEEWLEWAKAIPGSMQHVNKPQLIKDKEQALRIAKRGLARAKGLEPELDQEAEAAQADLFERLVNNLGSFRKARQAMGLPVDDVPGLPPPPGSKGSDV